MQADMRNLNLCADSANRDFPLQPIHPAVARTAGTTYQLIREQLIHRLMLLYYSLPTSKRNQSRERNIPRSVFISTTTTNTLDRNIDHSTASLQVPAHRPGSLLSSKGQVRLRS